jgi:hypothetical protein
MDLKFRPLRADEVELRVSTCNANGFSLLLYKDARCDMNILDETVGALNWMRTHLRDNANCIVAIWDADKDEWIAKEDTGTESFTEKEKGLASDSFKRACVNWGIGRELYTAPFIWINGHTVQNDRGKYVPEKSYDRTLRIADLVTTDGVITKLIIKDNTGKAVFSYGVTQVVTKSPEWEEAKQRLVELAEIKGKPIEEVLNVAQVDALEKLDLKRLEGAISWLSQQ